MMEEELRPEQGALQFVPALSLDKNDHPLRSPEQHRGRRLRYLGLRNYDIALSRNYLVLYSGGFGYS